MNENQHLTFTPFTLLVPLTFVFAIWVVYWIEIHFGYNFNRYGVYPRTLSGFKGVFLMHFIHSNTSHLFNNSVPLIVLISTLCYFYRTVAFKILIFGGLFTGFLTWSIARESYHIGASGLVYLLFSFVFFSGAIKQNFRLLAVSLVVIFLYGSMIWYILPVKDGMSWEGHLSGFLVGLLMAIIYRKQGIQKETIQFTTTAFDMLFDEAGNLKSTVDDEESTQEQVSKENADE